MAGTIVISSLIFISIWILAAIAINRIAQKRANNPYLKNAYRMWVYLIFYNILILEDQLV